MANATQEYQEFLASFVTEGLFMGSSELPHFAEEVLFENDAPNADGILRADNVTGEGICATLSILG